MLKVRIHAAGSDHTHIQSTQQKAHYSYIAPPALLPADLTPLATYRFLSLASPSTYNLQPSYLYFLPSTFHLLPPSIYVQVFNFECLTPELSRSTFSLPQLLTVFSTLPHLLLTTYYLQLLTYNLLPSTFYFLLP